MKIDGIGFNKAWAATKTEAEFVKEFTASNMGHIYPEVKDKAVKLKAVYAVLTGKKEEAKAIPVSAANGISK